MLMVVFGAGASYDSVPSRPPDRFPKGTLDDRRPPLANELFDDRPSFVDAMSKFRKCQPVIPYLQNLPKDGSVERVLEGLQAETEQYPERHSQLAAIRFYLHFMMWECERFWKEVAKGVTNYKTLLDQIERWRKPEERICLVTFNYDRMLEADLPTVGVEIQELSDYIANDHYKVIKLHGSVNWAREVNTPIQNLNDLNTWQVGYELIERAGDLDISQRYLIVTQHPIGKLDESAVFPALAIPVERKRDYECPPAHLETLVACIPEVTKLLVIGWRATEYHFLKLLVENLRQELKVTVVSEGSNQAEEVVERLKANGIKGQYLAAESGFTDFIINREVDDFLRD